jgi:hypothetical protein
MQTKSSRAPLARTPDEQAEEDAFLALYGAWEPMAPATFAKEMEGFDRPWWVVGGWALEVQRATGESMRTLTYPFCLAMSPPSSSLCGDAGMSGTTSEVCFIHLGPLVDGG